MEEEKQLGAVVIPVDSKVDAEDKTLAELVEENGVSVLSGIAIGVFFAGIINAEVHPGMYAGPVTTAALSCESILMMYADRTLAVASSVKRVFRRNFSLYAGVAAGYSAVYWLFN